MTNEQGNLQYSHQENKSMKCIPHKTHFYMVKMGFIGLYNFFSSPELKAQQAYSVPNCHHHFCCPHCSNISSETAGLIKAKLHVEHP